MTTEAVLRKKWSQVLSSLDERGRREWAAAEALAIGYGGLIRVHRATGLARSTIRTGIKELESGEAASVEGPRRIRGPGGGRKKKTDKDPTLLPDLESLIEPGTRGDPESPLRWTLKSVRTLARELNVLGHTVS